MSNHRPSAYFLTQTSSAMRDKQWRTRCGSEARRGKGRARGRNPITWDGEHDDGTLKDKKNKKSSGARARKTLAAAGSAISAASGIDVQNVAPPATAAATATVARAARKGMTTAMAAQAHKNVATELMKAKFKEQQLAYVQEREQRAKAMAGRPPLAERKVALTALKLKQLERAQAQQARRMGLMDASVRSSGRKSVSGQSTGRSTGRSTSRSSRRSGRESSRSSCSTARGDKTGRSNASWSSKLSIDSRTSNLTEKALDRIEELEKALERERKLREMAERSLAIVSLPSSRAGSSVGEGSTARSTARR